MKRSCCVVARVVGCALLLVVVTAWSGMVPVLSAQQLPTPDLTGTVTDETGQPLAEATVFIYTAGPKEGVGVLCPSCYPDCRKRTTTDTQGRFTIEDLDPTLLFRILVAGPRFQPEFVEKVDPAEKPVEVSLKRVSGGDAPSKRMRGRVIDGEGNPVSGAVVSIRGVSRGSGTRFGGNRDIDPVAVSDPSGEFVIHGEEPFDAVGVEVEARALAKGVFQHLATGDAVHELKLTEGVAVTGRLLHQGSPLAGATVGICGAERRSEIFVGDYAVATDGEGRFGFVNLPPRTGYFLYGVMSSLGERGTLPARNVRSQEDGSTLDVGDLALQPAFSVEGMIRLTDDGTIPEKTRVFLGREEAWDSQQMELDDKGRFRFVGVPDETVTLSARLLGYRPSLRNASLDPLNPFHLNGRVRTNITGLIFEFEPGERHDRLDGDQRALREEPLRGAEAINTGGDIQVSGSVTDAETGQPLPSFTVTEGRRDEFRSIFNWFSTRKTVASNGTFTVYFMNQRQAPGVLVEAEGYLSLASGEITTTQTNLTIALRKGSGPAGLLLTADGVPAVGVKVYLTDTRNKVYVSGENMEVRENIYRGTRSTLTDETGRFSFPPRVDAGYVVVVDEAGYAEIQAADLTEHSEVRLQAWARVTGRLLIGDKPGANESIRLWPAHIPYQYEPHSARPLNLFLNTTTDDEGFFEFPRVPPISVEVYHSPKVSDSRMGTVPMSQTTKFALQPRELRHLSLGGRGRPVIGRVVVDGYEGQINWRTEVQTLESIVPDPPGLPNLRTLAQEFRQTERDAKTDEEMENLQQDYQRRREEATAQLKAFHSSPAGRDLYFAKRRFALNFAQDGTFRIEDVPGGKYTLKINLREGSGDGPSRFSAPSIADLDKQIEVPPAPGGRTEEPLDLGIIELTARIANNASQ